MKKMLLLLSAGLVLAVMVPPPAQAVPNEIEKRCISYFQPNGGMRDVTICEALEQSTPVPPGNEFWGRVYVKDAGSGTGYSAPWQICCTVTMWEADTGSSNFNVASAGTVLWNRGDGDQTYGTSHIDKSNLQCKIHVEAGGESSGVVTIQWIQGGPKMSLDTQGNPNNPDVNLSNYGDNNCP